MGHMEGSCCGPHLRLPVGGIWPLGLGLDAPGLREQMFPLEEHPHRMQHELFEQAYISSRKIGLAKSFFKIIFCQISLSVLYL